MPRIEPQHVNSAMKTFFFGGGGTQAGGSAPHPLYATLINLYKKQMAVVIYWTVMMTTSTNHIIPGTCMWGNSI